MKRTIAIPLLTLALLTAGYTSTTTAQNNCQPCFQQAQHEFNVAFNQCRDGEGCSDPGCSNCVGEGTSAKQDYINSTCPSCYDPLLDGPTGCPPVCERDKVKQWPSTMFATALVAAAFNHPSVSRSARFVVARLG